MQIEFMHAILSRQDDQLQVEVESLEERFKIQDEPFERNIFYILKKRTYLAPDSPIRHLYCVVSPPRLARTDGRSG